MGNNKKGRGRGRGFGNVPRDPRQPRDRDGDYDESPTRGGPPRKRPDDRRDRSRSPRRSAADERQRVREPDTDRRSDWQSSDRRDGEQQGRRKWGYEQDQGQERDQPAYDSEDVDESYTVQTDSTRETVDRRVCRPSRLRLAESSRWLWSVMPTQTSRWTPMLGTCPKVPRPSWECLVDSPAPKGWG